MSSTGDNIINLAMERRRRGPRFNGGLMDILEVSRDLVCLCRAGAITAINGAGARMLGAGSTEQVIGRRLGDFLIPEYGPVLDLFLAGMASEDKAVPTRIVALDGSATDVEMQVFRAREIAPDATVVMCRDISAEGRLIGNGHGGSFQAMVENALGLFVHVQGGVIRYVNRAGIALLGAKGPEAVVGRKPADFGIPAEPTGTPARLSLKRADGAAIEAMVQVTRLPAPGDELMVEARDVR